MTSINGIILLDKPSNYDSHQVTRLIQRMLNADKIGHSGTLDPKVTGVLVIFLGRATRLANYLFGKDKTYVGIMNIHENIGIEKLKKAMKKFTGKIKQMPPVKSAVKRQERIRKVYSFKIIEKKAREVLFSVECESGTYVRKLIHDLGEKMKIGAHMTELRRVREGLFTEGECVSMYDIENAIKENKVDSIIKPYDIICKDMIKVTAKNEFLEKLCHGSPVLKSFVKGKRKIKKGSIIAVMSEKNELIEISEVTNEKNVLAKPSMVIKNGISRQDKNFSKRS